VCGVVVQKLKADKYSGMYNLQCQRSKLIKHDVDILSLTIWIRCVRADVYAEVDLLRGVTQNIMLG
jgi:hypothetical protein